VALLGSVDGANVQSLMGTTCLAWAVALLWVKGYPSSAILWRSRAMRLFMGFMVLVPAWAAVMFLLSVPYGPVILICMVATVAVADIGGYFAGRAFGKHKLAPSVSPAKTWEGFWGGFLACALFGGALWYAKPIDLSVHQWQPYKEQSNFKCEFLCPRVSYRTFSSPVSTQRRVLR